MNKGMNNMMIQIKKNSGTKHETSPKYTYNTISIMLCVSFWICSQKSIFGYI